LGDTQPDHRLSEWASALLHVLNILSRLVALEPRQAALRQRICDEALIGNRQDVPDVLLEAGAIELHADEISAKRLSFDASCCPAVARRGIIQ
jgi:hypothetical protein